MQEKKALLVLREGTREVLNDIINILDGFIDQAQVTNYDFISGLLKYEGISTDVDNLIKSVPDSFLSKKVFPRF